MAKQRVGLFVRLKILQLNSEPRYAVSDAFERDHGHVRATTARYVGPDHRKKSKSSSQAREKNSESLLYSRKSKIVNLSLLVRDEKTVNLT